MYIGEAGQYQYAAYAYNTPEITPSDPIHEELLKARWTVAWVERTVGGSLYVYHRLIPSLR